MKNRKENSGIINLICMTMSNRELLESYSVYVVNYNTCKSEQSKKHIEPIIKDIGEEIIKRMSTTLHTKH